MNRPNLFQIAVSELSQDAFFAWLIQWADPSNMLEYTSLCAAGQDFIRFLIDNNDKETGMLNIDKVVVIKQKVFFQNRPRKRKDIIDLWIEVNDRFLIVIEDKTGTAEHSEQLDRYREIAYKYCAEKSMQPILIYLKTQDETLSKIKIVQDKKFRFISRKDLLTFFDDHALDNDIYQDFASNLTRIETQSESFRTCPIGQWSWGTWCGFFSYIEKEINSWGEWKYVPNPSGGFLGLCWSFLPWKAYMVYLQIEQRINRDGKFEDSCRLCFKIQHVKENHLIIRKDWAKIILTHAGESGCTEIKTARCRKGENMTVAFIDRKDWLGHDGCIINLEHVLARLHRYENFFTECVSME